MFRFLAAMTAVLGLLTAPGAAPAVTVSGQVVDEQGFGIFNVDLDFKDLSTGQIVFTPFDNTDAGGFYSVDVPPAEYEITFTPPPGSPYLERIMDNVVITTNTTIDTFLWNAQLVTGTVVDALGAPLQNVDLDFFDVATGDEYEANDDNTDAFGQFSIFVPGLTFDIFFTPPLGMPKAATVLFGVAVAGTTSLGTITLEDGFFVSGQVRDPVNLPVGGADTDFADAATGEVLYTPRDNTDPSGNLNVVVPAGTFDMTIKPPPGTGLAWKTLHDLTVASNVNLGTVQLETGFAVTGTVRNETAQPVAGADLDMVELATGRDLPTPDDNTNGAGVFSLLSPATTFDLHVKPSAASGLAAAIVRNVTVSGPLNLGTVTVETGFPITGVVRDVFGAPVAGADLDAFELGNGLFFPTVDDDTDAAGAYSIRLPGGSYTLTATPPVGSGLQPASVVVDPLDAPAVIDFVLPSGTVDAGVTRRAAGFALGAAPNPFRASTLVAFDLPLAREDVRVSVFDLAGRKIRELRGGPLGAGRHSVRWDGRDDSGRRIASGVYLIRLESESGSLTRKATLLR